jgi:hypothetical protein
MMNYIYIYNFESGNDNYVIVEPGLDATSLRISACEGHMDGPATLQRDEVGYLRDALTKWLGQIPVIAEPESPTYVAYDPQPPLKVGDRVWLGGFEAVVVSPDDASKAEIFLMRTAKQ